MQIVYNSITAADINELTPPFAAASHRAYQTSASSWRSATSDSSIESAAIPSTSYIAFCATICRLSELWSVVFIKMLEKEYYLPVNANLYQLVKYF